MWNETSIKRNGKGERQIDKFVLFLQQYYIEGKMIQVSEVKKEAELI